MILSQVHAIARRLGLAGILASLSLVFAVASPAAASTVGEQKTALLLVNFQDNATQPVTVAAANALMFGQVGDYFWEASYHHTLISGDTFGWYALPMAATCATNEIGAAARQAAAAAGVDLSAYSRVVFVYPANLSCGTAGTAVVGGTEVFINGHFDVGNVAHEMGHSFGLEHSGDLACDKTAISDTCVSRQYGDFFDVMGQSGNEGHFNAIQKERLGWLNGSGTPAITTVLASGSFQLTPFELASNDTKALKILKGSDPVSGARTWYYIEYRQAIGFDRKIANLPATNVTKGVLVHQFTEGDARSSRVLDMTTNSNFYDENDSALVAGQSFYDPAVGLTITTRSADGNGALVDIILTGGSQGGSCAHVAPALSLTGPGSTVPAGSAVAYTLSLTNRDSAACTATTFNLAKSLPSGWTGSLASNSLSVSPGASASTMLTVTSTATATAGSYAIGASSSSAITTSHAASANASYVVAAAASTLSDSVGTDKSVYLRGETVYLSARVLANGQPLTAASVKFNLSPPGGGSTIISAVTGSDGYARSTYKVGKGKAAIGAYGLRADASSGGATATSASTFSAN